MGTIQKRGGGTMAGMGGHYAPEYTIGIGVTS